ncbi:MAG: hypothetical protein ABIP75_16070, partial [Pyrinomonadaceae bacterium]
MSEEELNRKMEFIVDQLADLTVKQQTTENIVTRLATSTLDRLSRIDEKVEILIDAQIKADQRFDRIDEKFQILIDAQIKADQRAAESNTRLDRLATAVEQMV